MIHESALSAKREGRGTALALFVRRNGNEVRRSATERIFLPHTSPYTGSRGPARGPGCRCPEVSPLVLPLTSPGWLESPFPILHLSERRSRDFVTARDTQSA